VAKVTKKVIKSLLISYCASKINLPEVTKVKLIEFIRVIAGLFWRLPEFPLSSIGAGSLLGYNRFRFVHSRYRAAVERRETYPKREKATATVYETGAGGSDLVVNEGSHAAFAD
jgi:hypothetical protein